MKAQKIFAIYFLPMGVFFIIYIGKEWRIPAFASGRCSGVCPRSKQWEPLSKKAPFHLGFI
jgi:hypothetical protein